MSKNGNARKNYIYWNILGFEKKPSKTKEKPIKQGAPSQKVGVFMKK